VVAAEADPAAVVDSDQVAAVAVLVEAEDFAVAAVADPAVEVATVVATDLREDHETN
jgi:hypothetical protein